MAGILFPRFLEDSSQYRESGHYWRIVWSRVDPVDVHHLGWKAPWLGTGSPDLQDGNPIFSAWSERLGRGIRVIQEEPAEDSFAFHAWLDTFGGDRSEPGVIEELVISCVLSEQAAERALGLMIPWVRGQELEGSTWDGVEPIRIQAAVSSRAMPNR